MYKKNKYYYIFLKHIIKRFVVWWSEVAAATAAPSSHTTPKLFSEFLLTFSNVNYSCSIRALHTVSSVTCDLFSDYYGILLVLRSVVFPTMQDAPSIYAYILRGLPVLGEITIFEIFIKGEGRLKNSFQSQDKRF